MNDSINKLYFEVTSRCNLNCKMCFRHSWINEDYGDIDMGLFYKALDDNKTMTDTHTVFFGGMGESLVHPEIINMIKYCKTKDVRVELLTNGTMLDEEMSERLIEAGLDKLWVSVDGFDEINYEKIQIGSTFSGIIDNLKKFNNCRKGTHVELGICIVVMKSNLNQMGNLKRFYDDIEADDINFSHMLPNTLEDENDSLWHVAQRADLIGEADGFDSDIMNEKLEFVWKGEVRKREADKCRFIEENTCFIRWDGEVSPCMGLLHSSKTVLMHKERTVWHHSFGNLNDKPLSEIWYSDEYAEFREKVRNFEFSPCTNCGGCEYRDENIEDCFGNEKPVCGACLWGQGYVQCP